MENMDFRSVIPNSPARIRRAYNPIAQIGRGKEISIKVSKPGAPLEEAVLRRLIKKPDEFLSKEFEGLGIPSLTMNFRYAYHREVGNVLVVETTPDSSQKAEHATDFCDVLRRVTRGIIRRAVASDYSTY